MIYDALVVGAGPAGSVCALLLARAGWRVAIVEKSEFPRRKVCGEFVSAPALGLLHEAGLRDLLTDAGPEIREVAIYAGNRRVRAPMPRGHAEPGYGRALGRDRLDDRLLRAACDAGAEAWQPSRVERCERSGRRYACTIGGGRVSESRTFETRVVVAAHGAWDTGGLAARAAQAASSSDLFAFKARFAGAALEPSTMPLVTFPGGYGGLVTSDRDEVSFSCCIARDALARCRGAAPGESAGAAVFAHALRTCGGLRVALAPARRVGSWLAVGALRPGFHAVSGHGVFAIGNAMAEAHPIVAEGISMAIQSAALLAGRLIAAGPSWEDWSGVARDYDAAYRRNFGARIRASAAFAQVAMRPAAAAAVTAMLGCAPPLIALGARWAGKASPLNASA